MRTLLFIGVLMLASCSESQVKESGSSTNETTEQQSGYQVVGADKFKEILSEDVQLVDVRTAQEYSAGTIEGAVNIDVLSSDFAQKIGKLDKSKKTLIFCRSGSRSARAGGMMEDMGFENIVDLSGGYMGWPYK